MNIADSIAEELAVKSQQVAAAVKLLDEGATVPFISRYRKEITGGLDDSQLRHLEERLIYLRELQERRETIIKVIDEQGKLSTALKADILAAQTKTRLEDLYRPYMKKRRTRAQIAREAGLESLAQALFDNACLVPEQEAEKYIDPEQDVDDVTSALEGARQILMERFADDATLIGELREFLWQHAQLCSKVVKGKEQEGAKFSDYFDAAEAIKAIPSHRALALMRASREGIIRLNIKLEEDDATNAKQLGLCESRIAHHFKLANQARPADQWRQDCCRSAWRAKIFPHLESELRKRLREQAEQEAIKVFGHNLGDLLLSAPAGAKVTMGLDPGLRTGVKVAVVDETGKLLDTATIYPHAPKNQWDKAISTLARLCTKHQVQLVSIGNGTASRETDKLSAELMAKYPQLALTKIMVSEAGASVYSASELAANEFPELDVTLRGAVSIARRLQDPLAELVKIEPKSIGVGQYQHDVNQNLLGHTLSGVVEDCVNAVGVDVNMASAPLLIRVAGLSPRLADNIVEYRNQHGAFQNRKQLLKVPRLGAKAFEQCAGFLRVVNGDNPLDASAVHPEAYPLVQKILSQSKRRVNEVIGDNEFLNSINPRDFIDEVFGEPTIKDIIAELDKPGRDPRPEFKTATFKDGVESLQDLKPDMVLEGVVTNVTNFGAFVDIGVHQDGLVHISLLADRFVKDPHQVVKAGEVVKVKVMSVDIPRKRIGLSMRMLDSAKGAAPRPGKNTSATEHNTKPVNSVAGQKRAAVTQAPTAMSEAFAALKK